MDITVIAFLALLLAVAVLRIVELRVSTRHQQQMIANGATKVKEPRFRWIVLLHIAVLAGAALEVVLLRRPFIPILATRSEEHTSELQSPDHLVSRLLLEKKK